MTSHNQDDRRTHPRYTLRAFAQLGSSDQEWAAHLLDISYEGARIALLDEYNLTTGDSVRLRIEVPQANISEGEAPYLQLHGKLVHVQEHMLGIHYHPETESDAVLLKKLLAELQSS
jgi:hypothetical protein